MIDDKKKSFSFDKYALLKYLITTASLILAICLRSSRGMFVTCAVMLISLFVDLFQFGDEVKPVVRINRYCKITLYIIGGFCLFVAILFLFYSADLKADVVSSFNAIIEVWHPFTAIFYTTENQVVAFTYKDISLSMLFFNCSLSVITVLKPWILIRQSYQAYNDPRIFLTIDSVFKHS